MKRLDHKVISILRALKVREDRSLRASSAPFILNLADPDVSRLATFYLPLPRQISVDN